MKSIRLRWTTAALVGLAFVVAMGRSASGEIIKVVSPSSFKSVESPDFANPAAVPVRIQYLFPAADFAEIAGSNRRIVAWNFRGDASQTQPFSWISTNSQIWMSTTDKSPATLTNVYDNNHGANKSLVHNGAISFPILATGPTQGPRDFAAGPRLQTPFNYDPSQGNLLIEWQRFDGLTTPRIDVQSITGPGARVLLNQTSPTAASGNFLNVPPVIQFEFEVVPEPSTLVLASLVLLGLGGRRQR